MTADLIFLLIFLLATFLFTLHAFFILYHLIRFGIGTRPKQAALIFFMGCVFLFISLGIAYLNIDTDKIIAENLRQQNERERMNDI
jgi:hypothetical protein